MSNPVAICVVGSGYVGLVAAACFAEMGHKVLCVDNDEAKVKVLREGGVPIFERFLPDLLAKHRGNALNFTTGSARSSSLVLEDQKICVIANFDAESRSVAHGDLPSLNPRPLENHQMN